MKQPGVVVISVLLGLLGWSLLWGHREPSFLPFRLLQLGLAVFTLVCAEGLWRRRRNATELYAAWAASYLIFGCSMEIVRGEAGLLEALIRFVFVGAVFAAVGLHLRWALRQADWTEVVKS